MAQCMSTNKSLSQTFKRICLYLISFLCLLVRPSNICFRHSIHSKQHTHLNKMEAEAINDVDYATEYTESYLSLIQRNDPEITEIHFLEELTILNPNQFLVALYDALLTNNTVTKLFIRNLPHAIDDRGALALYSVLLHNSHITDVFIENVKFEGLFGLREVFSGIARNPNSAVQNLTIASADFIEYEEEDDVVHCDPTAVFLTDAEGLAELLRSTTTLRKIDMSPNGIGDYVATRVLAPALAENSSVTELDVSHNDDLTETGLHALRNAIGGRGTVIMDCIDEENERQQQEDTVHVIPEY